MSVKQILIEAKALIDTPEKWTQDAYARDVEGQVTTPSSIHAVCFCSTGAINKVNAPFTKRDRALTHLTNSFGTCVPDFNDQHTHAELMDAWDRAIATAPN